MGLDSAPPGEGGRWPGGRGRGGRGRGGRGRGGRGRGGRADVASAANVTAASTKTRAAATASPAPPAVHDWTGLPASTDDIVAALAALGDAARDASAAPVDLPGVLQLPAPGTVRPPGTRAEFIRRGFHTEKAIAAANDGELAGSADARAKADEHQSGGSAREPLRVVLRAAGHTFRAQQASPSEGPARPVQEAVYRGALAWLEQRGRAHLRGDEPCVRLPPPQLPEWPAPAAVSPWAGVGTAQILLLDWDDGVLRGLPAGGSVAAGGGDSALRSWLAGLPPGAPIALDAEWRWDHALRTHRGAALLQLAPLDERLAPPILIHIRQWTCEGRPCRPFPSDLVEALLARQCVVWGAGKPGTGDRKHVARTLGIDEDAGRRASGTDDVTRQLAGLTTDDSAGAPSRDPLGWLEAQELVHVRYPALKGPQGGGTGIGLAAAARMLLGVDPPKDASMRKRDWSKQLDESAAYYAALDAVLIGEDGMRCAPGSAPLSRSRALAASACESGCWLTRRPRLHPRSRNDRCRAHLERHAPRQGACTTPRNALARAGVRRRKFPEAHVGGWVRARQGTGASAAAAQYVYHVQ